MFFLTASVKGLKGGHSGDDINKKRANAIKILARFLYKEQEKMDLRLAQFNSGKLHNAIPRDGSIVFAVPASEKETVRADWNVFTANIEEEFHVTEPVMEFNLGSTDAESVLPRTQAAASSSACRLLTTACSLCARTKHSHTWLRHPTT